MNNWTNHKTNAEVLELNIKERLGQTNISKYGLPMTIVAYRNTKDIDVNIDGTIIEHTTYRKFLDGNICKTRSDNRYLRVGETSVNKDGQKMTCIIYRLASDIDIQFEDGTILTHKDYYAFKRGLYRNPNYIKPIIKKPKKEKVVINRVGETNIAKNGQQMTIIAYRGHKDIDIQFDDGTVVTNKRYQHFKQGDIKNPNITNEIFQNSCKTSRIGQSTITNEGKKITIIGYRNSKDIDIQFEDGTVLKNRYYRDFLQKCVQYPKEHRIGMTNLHNTGLQMTIINYKNSRTLDVQFEDGYIAKNVDYRRFIQGKIPHPYPYMLGNCQIEAKAYNYGTERNLFYICKCCHHHDIGTIEEIKNHKCIEV